MKISEQQLTRQGQAQKSGGLSLIKEKTHGSNENFETPPKKCV